MQSLDDLSCVIMPFTNIYGWIHSLQPRCMCHWSCQTWIRESGTSWTVWCYLEAWVQNTSEVLMKVWVSSAFIIQELFCTRKNPKHQDRIAVILECVSGFRLSRLSHVLSVNSLFRNMHRSDLQSSTYCSCCYLQLCLALLLLVSTPNLGTLLGDSANFPLTAGMEILKDLDCTGNHQ